MYILVISCMRFFIGNIIMIIMVFLMIIFKILSNWIDFITFYIIQMFIHEYKTVFVCFAILHASSFLKKIPIDWSTVSPVFLNYWMNFCFLLTDSLYFIFWWNYIKSIL
jgi:hypothetical protein